MNLNEIWSGKKYYVIEDKIARQPIVSLREARNSSISDSVVVRPLYAYVHGEEIGAPPSIYFIVPNKDLGRPMEINEARKSAEDSSLQSQSSWFLVEVISKPERGRR